MAHDVLGTEESRALSAGEELAGEAGHGLLVALSQAVSGQGGDRTVGREVAGITQEVGTELSGQSVNVAVELIVLSQAHIQDVLQQRQAVHHTDSLIVNSEGLQGKNEELVVSCVVRGVLVNTPGPVVNIIQKVKHLLLLFVFLAVQVFLKILGEAVHSRPTKSTDNSFLRFTLTFRSSARSADQVESSDLPVI